MIEWRTTVHDGPVKLMAKCPFMPHLLLSVGGYSFAVWNEGVMVSICIIIDIEISVYIFMIFPELYNINDYLKFFRVNPCFNIL